MRRTVRTLLPALGLLAAGRTAHAQYTAYGLVNVAGAGQQLVSFNTANPSSVSVLGVTGQSLTGIDFRPATGQLFGFNGSALFTLSTANGAATPVGGGIGQTVAGNVGFDFNPTVDRIRLVGQSGTNLRLNPDNGAVAATDNPYTYAGGDAGAGQTPVFGAVAYTNSLASAFGTGATGTTLFGIDANRGTLVRIDNPNGGTVSTVGSGLGLAANVTVTGFDIVTVGSANFAFLTAVGMGNNAASSLYTVNLATGAATFAGSVGPTTGNGRLDVQGLAIAPTAVVPEPGTWALLATGLAGVAGLARRRRTA
jgi:hypothetical protein